MTVFADSSALYAVLDRDDRFHEPAREAWKKLVEDRDLTTSNYVVLECFALLQSRLGMRAVRTFHDDMLPVMEVLWVMQDDHGAAAQAVLAADRRGLSLVDCSSFRIMRRLRLARAFTFDQDFAEQGFEIVPGK